jgi:hypothetical protein
VLDVGGVEHDSVTYPDAADLLLIRISTRLRKRRFYGTLVPRKRPWSLRLNDEMFDMRSKSA